MKNPIKLSLKQNNLAPHKRFGQNFLVNEYIAQSIVNCGEFSAQDTIVEVGVGLGALTNLIAARAEKVLGLEIDSGLIKYHQNTAVLAKNVELLHLDVLKADLPSLCTQSGHKLKIIANLPYSISNPFIFKLIENSNSIDWVVVMLQKEMAERLIAQPASKQYGIPTVLLGAYAHVQKMFIVKPHEFHPQPKIDSMVIRIDFQSAPDPFQGLPETVHTVFQHVVHSSFAQRRKTLLNNLMTLPELQQANLCKDDQKNLLGKIFSTSKISASERAENLTLDDFIRLASTVVNVLPEDTSLA